MGTINLTKDDHTVNLDKEDGTQGILEVNLNWHQGKSGLFGRTKSIDFDLACLYQLDNGDKGVVQALGDDFGSLTEPPFIMLDADDRSGATEGGETLRINLAQHRRFRRLLVFTYIYSGAANWAAADGVVTMVTPTGERIEVRLDESDRAARSCAIALITGTPEGVQVQREVRYIHGVHWDVDRAYDWGIDWRMDYKR